MLATGERDENDNDYTIAIRDLAAAIAQFGPDAVYEMLEEESGAGIMHDLGVAIAEHHPDLHAKLKELLAS